MTARPLSIRGRTHLARAGTLAVSLALVAGAAGASSVAAPPASSTPALTSAHTVVQPGTAANPSNPLAGRRWGVYKGRADLAWQPYASSSGTNRRLLAKIALRPKATWFGKWTATGAIKAKVRGYIAKTTGGDPSVLVQMTVFRMSPWEHRACRRLPTPAQRASYRTWINQFARGIGSAHVALILQPDGPFALCAPGHSLIPSRLIGYSARVFGSLPHTSVYIDGGASDWPARHPEKAAAFLLADGVRYARGFALSSTHYSSTASNITFGTQVVRRLAARGVRGKHFVISTSSNGRPFTFNRARGSNPDNAKVCETRAERICVTLGIPPTTDVDNPRWRLGSTAEARARRFVDGYMWFGRPWLYMQSSPFRMHRALAMARTTPF